MDGIGSLRPEGDTPAGKYARIMQQVDSGANREGGNVGSKFSRYVIWGAVLGASIAIGQILGELIARQLENAESNLKDDETNATEGEMRETIISQPLGSAELCAVTSPRNKRD